MIKIGKSLQTFDNWVQFIFWKNVLRFDHMYIQMCWKLKSRASHFRQKLFRCEKHGIVHNEGSKFLHLKVQLRRCIIDDKRLFWKYSCFMLGKKQPKLVQNHPFCWCMRAKVDNDASQDLREAFIFLGFHYGLGEAIEVHLSLPHPVNRLIIGQICQREQSKTHPEDVRCHLIARLHGTRS